MSKYTRLNKINHYHDSSSLNEDSRIKPPLCSAEICINNYCNNSGLPASEASKAAATNESLRLIRRKPKQISNMKPSSISRNSAGSNNNNKLTKNLNSKLVQYDLKLAFFAAFVISLLLIMLVSINGVHSLNCYHCSSVDNPDCDEAFAGKANITDTDCEKHIGRPAKVCRKIVQYIEQKKVVIRSCGYIDDREEKDRKPMCNKRSGTFAIMMESCNCYTDNCNHSASLVPNRSVSLLATCFVILFYLAQSSLFNKDNNMSRPR